MLGTGSELSGTFFDKWHLVLWIQRPDCIKWWHLINSISGKPLEKLLVIYYIYSFQVYCHLFAPHLWFDCCLNSNLDLELQEFRCENIAKIWVRENQSVSVLRGNIFFSAQRRKFLALQNFVKICIRYSSQRMQMIVYMGVCLLRILRSKIEVS